MREQEFCYNNYNSLNELLNQSNCKKDTQEFKLSTILAANSESIAKDESRFNGAEHWLNSHGIETRTEYGNLLPTYNLFLKIGEWLERRIVEENDE